MANVKISNLPAATDVTGSDLLPIVDNGTSTTKKATFQQALDYVTGSTFNDLTVTSLTASVTGTFAGDGTGITGVTAEWDGSHNGNASITGSLDVTQAITASFIDVSGSTDFGSIAQSITDYHKFTGSVGIRFDGSGAGGDPDDRAFHVVRNADGTDLLAVYDNGTILARGATGATYASFGTAGSSFLTVDSQGITARNFVKVSTTTGVGIAKFVHANDDTTGIGFPTTDAVSVVLNGGDAATFSSSSSGHNLNVDGSLVADVELSGAVGSEITDSSYTLSADDRGKTLLFSSSATQGITCSSGLGVGFNTTFVQYGSGQLELSASSGVSLLNRQSHTKTAGTYAAASVVIISSDVYLLAGDTSS